MPMKNNYFLSPQVATEKFFLRELFSFFIEKRKEVFGDVDFTFSIEEFQKFIDKKNFTSVMGLITCENIDEHLNLCKNLKKRDENNKIINPQSPILIYEPHREDRNSFLIQGCQTEYIRNALHDIYVALKINDWSENGTQREDVNRTTFFEETKKHKLSYNGKETSRPLGNKERAFFEILKKSFGKNCPYSNLFDVQRRLARAGGNNLGIFTLKEKKKYVNDGITELRKKLYEISGNPDTIRTMPKRASIYRLIY